MAIRFRKSFKLAPGVRMNLSGGGLGWSVGPRGASLGIGSRGTFLNTGIPGTGLSMRHSLSSVKSTGRSTSTSGSSHSPPRTTSVSLTVDVKDNGDITFKDSNGNVVSDDLIEQAKAQNGSEIKALIQRTCDGINEQVIALSELHLKTPDPASRPTYKAQPFPAAPPAKPVERVPGFFEKLFKSKLAQIQQVNDRAWSAYAALHAQWEKERADFAAVEAEKQALISRAVAGDPEAMEDFLGKVLEDIVWPRETLVSFEVRGSGSKLSFDVDLPEIDDLPTKTASVPQRGLRLSVKDIGPTNVQKMYAKHIHSIGFRLLGEAFAMLPTVQEITLSGYSQRKNKATGQENDEYLYSVTVLRTQWHQIDIANLSSIDVLAAFTLFDLRRDMSKTGVFKSIEPF